MVQSGATMRKLDESYVIHNVLLRNYILYSEVVSLGCITSPNIEGDYSLKGIIEGAQKQCCHLL